MLKREIRSFGYAFRGLASAFRSEPHLRFHLLAAVAVVAAGCWFGLTRTEWCVVVLCIASVFAAELFNTAVEKLVDLVSPGYNKTAGLVKDLASAAVLITAAGAAIAGGVIFWDKL